MGLIEKNKEINKDCDYYISKIDEALQELRIMFSDALTFVDPIEGIRWQQKKSGLFVNVAMRNIKKYQKAEHYDKLLRKQEELFYQANYLPERIRIHNASVVKTKIQNAYSLIGEVERRKLDEQQMACIVKDTHNHLVIAGAGTGKTTTVVGKIKYLLKSKKCKPEEILVLSFTNASASEMSERINKETGCQIEASTFHKLGLNILTEVNGVVPNITQLNLRKFVKEQVLRNMESESYLRLLSTYLLYNRVISKSEFEFKTQAEYEEYLELNPPTTIQNEEVKSYGEMDIANFLAQNGIAYQYEQAYKIDTRTSEYGQYHPDFYLPEYDIYIEYFGINRKGEVPSYFKGKQEMSATQAYQASMEWKRKIHEENHTTMVECYAYEKLENILLEKLKERLEEKSIEMQPKLPKELWKEVASEGESVLDGVIELFETIINLMKSNNYSIENMRQLNEKSTNVKNNAMIISLIEPVFEAYETYLQEQGEIDFNDMINKASQAVKEGKYKNPYRYVIVDEYQDISKARFSLLENMRKSNYYDLFCVGDDWQSIYRFAGSDIGFILNFEKYWGATEVSKIETTYRFTRQLIEVSGRFIMQNPMQIKKEIKGKREAVGFALGEISGYTDSYAVEFMLQKLEDLPQNSSVFFIGRYSFDARILQDNPFLECQYNKISGVVEIKYSKRLDLKMNFMTAHKSKGLQADYVFIINNKKSRIGFPSKIQDAKILELLLENSENYPYAEERRLYYVALTRAKEKIFILTVNQQESEFVKELKQTYGEEMKKEAFICPICGGKLIRKFGVYGDFFGCSNYPKTGCTYIRKILTKEDKS